MFQIQPIKLICKVLGHGSLREVGVGMFMLAVSLPNTP